MSARPIREADWPAGTHVELRIAEPIAGRVAFTHEGWVYWVEDAKGNRAHASRPSALKRTVDTKVDGWEGGLR